MESLTIFPKFQVVVPKAIRELLKLKPVRRSRQSFMAIELIPLRSINQMRGFIRGINTTVDRKDGRV